MKRVSGKLLYQPPQIQTAVEVVARRVLTWVNGKLTLGWVTVLDGGRPFSTDLSNILLKLLPGLNLIRGEVRVKATEGTEILKAREVDLSGLDPKAFREIPILLVDDLVDSGRTLDAVKTALEKTGVQSIKTAVALNKHAALRGRVDFCALDLGLTPEDLQAKGLRDLWVYGYGMDLNGLYREEPAIWRMEIPLQNPSASSSRS
jgi:hypoxanthine phosphoribosyltransferase